MRVSRDGEEWLGRTRREGKGRKMWEWVLEGPPAHPGVGQTQKAVILTDFCFCLAVSRDCQEGKGKERGEGTRQGEKARTEPGQEEGAREWVDEEK